MASHDLHLEVGYIGLLHDDHESGKASYSEHTSMSIFDWLKVSIVVSPDS